MHNLNVQNVLCSKCNEPGRFVFAKIPPRKFQQRTFYLYAKLRTTKSNRGKTLDDSFGIIIFHVFSRASCLQTKVDGEEVERGSCFARLEAVARYPVSKKWRGGRGSSRVIQRHEINKRMKGLEARIESISERIAPSDAKRLSKAAFARTDCT